MRKRSSNLLLYLLQINRNACISKIMQQQQISLRTLRSDLVEINDFLFSINEPLFYIDDTGNIQNEGIINSDNTKVKLYAINNYSYRCNQTERQLLIFAILIKQNNYITMEYLAEKLFVSRITVLSDIELIKEVLADYIDITLSSKSSKGIKLKVNNEYTLRRLFVDLLRDIIVKISDENVFFHILERELAVDFSMNQIAAVLRKYESQHNILFSDDSFYEIALYFFIAFYRHQTGHILSNPNNGDLNFVKHDEVIYTLLVNCLAKLDATMTHQQILLTIDGIAGSQIMITSQHIEDVELYKIVVYFLSKIAVAFNANLEKDHLLIDSLVMHIKNMFDEVYLDFDFSWEEEFQQRFWDILDDINSHAFILERYLLRSLTEKMKFSIFIHICAALIRNKKNQQPLTILVVCPGSMATGRFVEAQLKNYFDFNIMGVVSADRILDMIKDRGDSIDFIVSTVDIATNLCPVIIVEPVLTNADFKQIEHLTFNINQQNGKKNSPKTSVVKPIIDILEKLDENNQSNFIADIEKVTSQYSETIKQKANTNITQMLGDGSCIAIIDHRLDWIEAIKISGNILLDKKYIEAKYIDEMVNNIYQYGPYIRVNKRIAIAHAKPEKYVHSEGLSLVLSKEGIYFDKDEQNTINLMFCFSTMGHLEYIDLFWQIARLGDDETFIEQLLNTADVNDAYQLITQKLN